MKKIVLGVIMAAVLLTVWNHLDINIKPKPKPSTVQAELDKYKQKEQKQTEREKELQRLSNPEIIRGAFRKDPKEICLEGTQQYKDFLNDKTYFGIAKRQLYIDFLYNYSYWIDKRIIGIEVEGTKAILNIPQDGLKLYVMLDENNSQMWRGKKLIFSQGYTPEDTTIIRRQITEKIIKDVSTPDYYNEAMNSLKTNLTAFCKELGYEEVEFNT